MFFRSWVGVFFFILLSPVYFSSLHGQQVSLVYPPNSWVGDTNSVTVKWNAVPSAQTYHVQVATDLAFSSIVHESMALSQPSDLVAFLSPGTYYWRVRYFNGVTNSAWSQTRLFRLIDLGSISSLALWWDPSYGVVQASGNVSQWADKSGNGHHGLQANALRQPVLQGSTLNGLPVLSFDGNSQFLKTNPFTLNQPVSFFLVFNKKELGYVNYIFDGNTSNLCRLGIDGSNSYLFYGGSFLTSDNSGPLGYKVFSMRYDNTSSTMRNNFSNLPVSGSPGTGNPGGFTLAALGDVTGNPSYHAFIDVAEVLIFNDTLSPSITDQIEQYLRFKYFPPVNLGQDIYENYSYCPVTLSGQQGYQNYSWSTGDTTQSVQVSTSGLYWLQVTDRMGNVSRDSVLVTLNAPQPYSIQDTSFCTGDSIFWNSGLQSSGYDFIWSHGETDSAVYIQTGGSYFYRVADTLGCFYYSDTVLFIENDFSNATLGPDAMVCSGNTLQLDQPAGNGTVFLWSTGSTDSITTVTTSGVYWVQATNAVGCSVTDSVTVTVIGSAPYVNFQATDICKNMVTGFSDLSTSGNIINQWNWDFGDGNFATSQNPLHQYADTGMYNVQLTVGTDVGCVNDTVIHIKIYSAPALNFSYSDTCERSATMFQDLSQPNAGTIIHTYWNFGNLSATDDTSSLSSPMYSYPVSGIYEIQLIAENSFGCRDTMLHLVEIKPGPVAGFSYNKTCLYEPISFTNLSTAASPLIITSYMWHFSATDSSVLINPERIYSSPGDYPVTINIVTDNGCSNTYTDTLHINKILDAGYLLTNDSICRGVSYVYQDTSLAVNTTITSWAWKFDNNGNSALQDPSFIFNEQGNQLVRLTVTSADNCVDSVKHTIFVKAPPVTAFTVSQQIGFPPLDVNFFNTSGTDAVTFNWDLGNGVTSFNPNPSTVYPDTGYYTAVLIATDGLGCSDTVAMPITVVRPTYNILLQSLICTETNGYMQFTTTMLNQSNIELTQVDYHAGMDNALQLFEPWTGNIGIGQLFTHTMPGQVLLVPGAEICCVEVRRVGSLLGDSMMNRRICAPMVNEFTVLDAYPNPTNGIVNLFYILPVNEKIEIMISDALGHIVQVLNKNGIDGVNMTQLDLSDYAAGNYYITILYQDQRITKKVVVWD